MMIVMPGPYAVAMRTTITLDDHLLSEAKERARESRQTLGEYVEEALRQRLSDGPRPRSGPDIPVFEQGTGLRPGIDASSNAALLDAADRD